MSHLYQRGQTYWLKYYVGGIANYRSLKTRDRKTADALRKKYDYESSMGDNPAAMRQGRIDRVLDQFYKHAAARNKPKTVLDDKIRINGYIRETGIRSLSQINTPSLSSYLHLRIDRDGISNRTANHIIRNIKTFLNWCVTHEYLASNPLSNFKRFKVDETEPKFLSTQQVSTVLDAAKELPIYGMVAVAIYTGMRKSEILRLKHSDIKNGTITVRISKSGRFRIIPIHEDLAHILKDLNLPFDIGDIQMRRKMGALRQMTGIKWLGWHSFRHTFASLLIISGVDIVTVGKLLGHSDIRTTQIYAHLCDTHAKESIKRLQIR